MRTCETSAGRWFMALLFLVSIAALLTSQPALGQSEHRSAKRLLGYYPEWSKYNSPPYSAEQIPYRKLTHIAHAFALLSAKADGTVEIPAGMIEPTLISRAHARGVKVLLSIGGGDGIQGPRFNEMAEEEGPRQRFVRNVRRLLEKYKYDGVDIDWEVPNAPDRANCTTLMQELRNGLPSPWIISMAVTADPRGYGQGFDIPALAPILDFMNVMTYDFYGTWSGATGLVSPLLQDPADPQQVGSVRTSMDLYARQYGIARAQLNIGTPFYGYEWDGTSLLWAVCSTCASSSQSYAPYIKRRINRAGWRKNYDSAARAPYLINEMLPGLITYDGVESTVHKVRYVMKDRHFGGVFMWELSADYDGGSQDLLDAMYDEWKSVR